MLVQHGFPCEPHSGRTCMNGHHSPRQVVFAFAVGRAEEAICPSWLAQQGSPHLLPSCRWVSAFSGNSRAPDLAGDTGGLSLKYCSPAQPHNESGGDTLCSPGSGSVSLPASEVLGLTNQVTHISLIPLVPCQPLKHTSTVCPLNITGVPALWGSSLSQAHLCSNC